MQNITESENKCIVIATATSKSFIKRMKLYHLFNEFKEIDCVSLKNLNSPHCLKTITYLCESLGYQIKPSDFQVLNDPREIILPIRELIYQIKKFCAIEKNNNTLDIDAFYLFVQSHEKSPSQIHRSKMQSTLFQMLDSKKEFDNMIKISPGNSS